MINREREFIKNSIILSIGTIVPKITSIITLPILTSCLSKSEYGTFDLLTVLTSLFLPLATLQIQAAAFRFLINIRDKREEQQRIVTNIFLFTVPISIMALAILYFFLFNLPVHLKILVLFYFFIDILLVTVRQVSRGLAKNIVYSISALMNALIEMFLIVILLFLKDGGLIGAIIALIFSQLISLAYIIYKLKLFRYINIKYFSISEIKEMIRYSWPMIPNSLSSWVMRVSDRLIITFFIGIEANAIYAVANKIPSILNLVQNTFSLAWQENATISVNDTDSGKYYGKMFNNILNILVGGEALLIAFTPILFEFLIQGNYEEAYNHILILNLSVMFSMIASYIGGIYIAHKKTKEIGMTTVFAAILNLLINILFIKFIGVYAASISTLVSYVWLAFYRMINVQKIQKINFNYMRIFLLLMILIFMSLMSSIYEILFIRINLFLSILIFTILNKTIVLKVFKIIKNILVSDY